MYRGFIVMGHFKWTFYFIYMLLVTTVITSGTVNKTQKLVPPVFFNLSIRTFDFKSCMMSCASNNVCGGFLYNPKLQICSAYHLGFKIDAERSKQMYRFCREKVCPIQEGYFKLKDSGLCIRVVEEMMTWEDSRRACFSQGADLIVLDTWVKTRILKRYLARFQFKPAPCGRRTWLGLRRYGQGSYEWVGRVKKNPYVDWSPGDPSYGQEYCGMYSYGKIGDVRCANPRYYICEIPDAN